MSDTCKIKKVDDLEDVMPRTTTFRLRHPLPQVFESKVLSSGRVRYMLSLPIEDAPQGVGEHLGLLAERHDLLELSCISSDLI